MKFSSLALLAALGLLALSTAPAHAAGALAVIVVTPTVGTVAYGGALQLTAEGRDASNAPVDVQPTFSWATDFGTISAGGLFTATRVGSAHITVTAGAFTGHATVNTPGTPRIIVTMDSPSQTAATALAAGVSGKIRLTYAEDDSPISGTTVSALVQRSLPLPGVPAFEQRAFTTDGAGVAAFSVSQTFTLPDHYDVIAVTQVGNVHREGRTSYDVTPHA